MTGPNVLLQGLRRRGLVWEHSPGLYALRGAPALLFRRLERLIGHLARHLAGGREWLTPAAIQLSTLARADYFASFPQWLTTASHLGGSDRELEAIAQAPDPAQAAAQAVLRPSVALPPAVCYHVYAALEGQRLRRALRTTVQGTCWRHEGCAFAPLARGWAFTMREIVHVGAGLQTEMFRLQGLAAARMLAQALQLDYEVVPASDPFFAPTARGKALLQQIKGLKHELILSIGDSGIAAASFNDHEHFFGSAFDISLPSGKPAHSACVAFGLERWLLAFLARHGDHPPRWPALPRCRDLDLEAMR